MIRLFVPEQSLIADSSRLKCAWTAARMTSLTEDVSEEDEPDWCSIYES